MTSPSPTCLSFFPLHIHRFWTALFSFDTWNGNLECNIDWWLGPQIMISISLSHTQLRASGSLSSRDWGFLVDGNVILQTLTPPQI